ncbi:inverse autotransporter beta domain-containing protein [Uliginosibacterium sp. 31-16]|uniref:inverse autotransporter beta domain-containing protein n=1 Tax=Uliginosibacterium sp. 31-16 TaxID=3068315 RepID=UPI00273F6AFB|nr:inverse autotransporter beta domain-containing protein [Uliginosibacterium sp. 31-16]MDP5238953.1 inverse autotransporter beta domain-containing protein [Uliginosibacterium sp. 31-16]
MKKQSCNSQAGQFSLKLIPVAVALALAPQAFAQQQWTPTIEPIAKHSNKRSSGSINAAIPLQQDTSSLLFADIKGSISHPRDHQDGESDGNEFNLGLAYRKLVAEGQWAVGGYGAWDRRRSFLGNYFNQITLGVEARNSWMDWRLNYYQPITGKKEIGLGDLNHFSGNNIYRNGVYEEALRGADLELGFDLPLFQSLETRIYTAAYTFKGDVSGPAANGWRGRLEARLNKRFTLGLGTQHDKKSGTTNFLSLSYAFGGGYSGDGKRSLRERMIEPWVRDDDIVLAAAESGREKDAKQTSDQAIHIDNSKATNGDGSYENPYNSVANCEAAKCFAANGDGSGSYNMIRLWQGNSAMGMMVGPGSLQTAVYAGPDAAYTGMTLLDGQTLWGEGYNIYTNVATPAKAPVISGWNGNGNGVTLASNGSRGNTVAGVKINAPVNGIYGSNTWGMVNIIGNQIDSVRPGINLSSDTGGYAGYAGIAAVPAVSAETPVSRSQIINIRDNTITTKYGHGIRVVGNSTRTSASLSQSITIEGNTVGAGLSGSSKKAGLTGKSILSPAGNGGYGGNAVSISTSAYYGGPISQSVVIRNNTLSAVAGNGINLTNYGDSTATQTISITGNTITVRDNSTVTSLDSGPGASRGVGISLNNFAYDADVTQTAQISGNIIDASKVAIYATNESAYGGKAMQSLTIRDNSLTAGLGGIALGNGSSRKRAVATTADVVKAMPASAPPIASTSEVQTAEISGNTLRGGSVGVAVYNMAATPGAQSVTISNLTYTTPVSNAVVAMRCTQASGSQTVTLDSGVTLNGNPKTGTVANGCVN